MLGDGGAARRVVMASEGPPRLKEKAKLKTKAASE